ncbi:hypothetical protein BH18ACT4_BH18ACT4_08180 [soil metagenome]
MTAVAACVRVRLRGSVRTTALFALLAAVAGAVLLTGVAGARRTESAYRRMLEHADAGHLLLYAPSITPEQLDAVPEVVDFGRASYVFARFPTLEDQGRQVVPFVALDDHAFRTTDRPRVLQGRMPEPDRAEEVAISEGMAERYGLSVGSSLTIGVFSLDQYERVVGTPDDPEPAGPSVDLEVTAVVRGIQDVGRDFDDAEVEYVGSDENLTLTPAFAEQHLDPELTGGSAYRIRLRGGDADLARFMGHAARLAGDNPIGPIAQAELNRRIERGTDILALALLLFGATAGILGLLFVGQALGRQGRADLAEASVLQAIGMRPRDLLSVGVSRAAVVAVAGALGAVGLAVAASPLFPVGLARTAEPSPGLDVDVPVLALGALAIVLVLTLHACVSAWWRLRRGDAPKSAERPGGLGVPDRLAQAGLPLQATTGVRLALDRGHGVRTVPLRTTLFGAVVGMAAITAVVVFGQSLDRLVDDTVRQGWNWDVVVGNPNAIAPVDGAEEALAASPIVEGFTAVFTAGLPLGGTGVTALGLEPVEGTVVPPLLEGRAPAADDEVALDIELLRRFDLSVGERFTAAGRRLVVVGEVAFPDAVLDASDGTEGGALMTAHGAQSFAADRQITFPTRWLVDLAPGVDLAEARRELGPTFGRTVLGQLRPDDVEYVATVAWMPYVMAALVAGFAVATVGHVLVASIRRRRDLAILKTLGLGRGDVRAVAAWQATTLGLFALVVGLPLGIVTGRWAWLVVADRLGARSGPQIGPLLVVLLVVAAVVVLNGIAAVPGRVAARIRPAVVLRSE